MVIRVKNPKLKKKVYKKLDRLHNLAMKALLRQNKPMKQNLSLSKKYEDRSDKLYEDNYYKIFDVTKKGKK